MYNTYTNCTFYGKTWTNTPHKLSRNNGKEKYTTHFMRKRMKISRKLERKYHQFCIIDKESFFLLATKIEKLEKVQGYKNGYIVKVADKLSYLLCNWSLNNLRKKKLDLLLIFVYHLSTRRKFVPMSLLKSVNPNSILITISVMWCLMDPVHVSAHQQFNILFNFIHLVGWPDHIYI